MYSDEQYMLVEKGDLNICQIPNGQYYLKLTEEKQVWGEYMSRLIIMAIGVILIGICILYINVIWACKIETTGKYIKYNIVHSYRGNTYEPVFRYYIKGEEFQGRCLNTLSLPKIQKEFIADQTYTIYVNDRKPEYFVVYRKVPIGCVIGVLFGIVFLMVGF